MYGLNDRNEMQEMRERYEAMINVLSELFSCGRWDIEEMFDSKNNIEVGEIVTEWVRETGTLPTWNDIYRDALSIFAGERDLEIGEDVDIFTNCCLDTHIYAKAGLDESIIDELQTLFNMDVEEMA